MKQKIVKSTQFAGRQLSLETGFLAEQAHGSVLARYGDTAVLATVVTAEAKEDTDFFPLSVEYEERLYAGGIIKGSRWSKREGKPTDDAILNGRVIDRAIRPLFPKDFTREVQIIVTVLSVDTQNDPVVLGMVATSAAIMISGIPWNGPVGGARVGRVNSELVLNPERTVMVESDMDLMVAATAENVLMIELGSKPIVEDQVLDAIEFAHNANREIIGFIKEFAQEVINTNGVGYTYEVKELTPEQEKEKQVVEQVKQYIYDNFPTGMLSGTILERDAAKDDFLEQLYTEFASKVSKSKMSLAFEKIARDKVRELIITTGTRIDGRKVNEVRPIRIEVGLLSRTHGSAVFTRGSTQVLNITTLGSTSLEQLIESPYGEEAKRYIHHYNFPPYSTGETGRVGTPRRREIGHGALAERAVEAVLPSREDFPYTIRLVSEVISSNGSTSMASVCGSTLSLMDAGVPISAPVSGVAMGLIKEGDTIVILTDIMGVEDFYGDMDFKVAGTEAGITALQLDSKIGGLSREIMKDALSQARVGRMHILGEMVKVIDKPREDLSKYAPKIQTIKINPKKIGEIIGPGGKVIRALQEETQTEIDIEDTGIVHIAGTNADGVSRAVEQIIMMTKEVEVGETYKGHVTRIMDFGAFVEVLPGREGLVHVSELANHYVKSVRDEVSEGDEFEVKVIEIDEQGRINLSRKALLAGEDHDSATDREQYERRDRNQSNNNRHGNNGRNGGGYNRGR
ncbi:polyribonucleotide nucleotidyltransferase [candidate division WWE3 bacterium]|nr:polyribonucleotide nucleotidyltransferase [candidate division WWE3 bacterium]